MGNEENILGNLIAKLKGRRTLKEFSADTDVSPAMLSRYINGKGSKPTPRTLIKLTGSSSNPQADITFDDLMVAAGYLSAGSAMRAESIEATRDIDYIMYDPEIQDENQEPYTKRILNDDVITQKKRRVHRARQPQREAIIKSIILDDEMIEEEGWYKAGRDNWPSYIKKAQNQLVLRNANDNCTWLFDIRSEVFEEEPEARDFLHHRMVGSRLGAYVKMPADINRKITFVTDSQGLFNSFCEYENCSYKGNLSVMLINIDQMRIEMEKGLTAW